MNGLPTTNVVICPLCKKTTIGIVFEKTDIEVTFKCLICNKLAKLPKNEVIIS